MSNCEFPLVGCSSQTLLTTSDQDSSYFNDRMVSGGVGSKVSFVKMDPTDTGWQHANSTIVFITTASGKKPQHSGENFLKFFHFSKIDLEKMIHFTNDNIPFPMGPSDYLPF